MIPRKIHYIWLSEEKKPALVQSCISTWQKVMPDYEIKCWNMDNIPNHHWIDESIAIRKWASASDYIRLYALYTEGGIYLDSDVMARKRFDCFLDADFFSAVEYNKKRFVAYNSAKMINTEGIRINNQGIIHGLNINAAIMGSIKENKFVKDAMDFYDSNHFVLSSHVVLKGGKTNIDFVAPVILAEACEQYGFRYKNENQKLKNDIILYKNNVLADSIMSADKNSYAIHICMGSWGDYSLISKIILKIKIIVKMFLLKTINM
jgi:hypothetical protein